MVNALTRLVIAVGAITAVFTIVSTTLWGTIHWPSKDGFRTLIIPAIAGVHEFPVVGTMLSMLIWIGSFEVSMMFTRLGIWVLQLIGVAQGQGPLR